MKFTIQKPVTELPVGLAKGKAKYAGILKAAFSLANGDWLPVVMESEKGLDSLQICIHGNRKYPRGTFETRRDTKQLTMYIRKKQSSEGEN